MINTFSDLEFLQYIICEIVDVYFSKLFDLLIERASLLMTIEFP